jgi:hypothetical protein
MGDPQKVGVAVKTIDPEILGYLRRFVVRRRMVALARAAGWAICFAIVAIAIECVADRLLQLNAIGRVVWLGITLIGVVWIIRDPILAMFRRIDRAAAADAIESRTRRFGQRLQTVASEAMGSAAMMEYLAGEVREEISGDDPTSLVSKRPAAISAAIAGILVAIVGGLAMVPSIHLPTLLARAVKPWAELPPVTTTVLSVSELSDSQNTIDVHAEQFGDEAPMISISADGMTWHRVAMTPVSSEEFVYSIGLVTRDLQYFVEAGDARSGVYRVRVKGY